MEMITSVVYAHAENSNSKKTEVNILGLALEARKFLFPLSVRAVIVHHGKENNIS